MTKQTPVPTLLYLPQGAAAWPEPLSDPEMGLLFRRYSSYVAHIAMSLAGRDGDVDDIVQDVFMDAMKGLRRLRDPAAVKGWLRTVTIRKARRRLRMRRFRSFLGLDSPTVYQEMIDPRANPEQRVLLSRVYGILDSLPVAQRIAWTLRYVEGEALDDVARLCRCSLATTKRRIKAAQSVIEGALADA